MGQSCDQYLNLPYNLARRHARGIVCFLPKYSSILILSIDIPLLHRLGLEFMGYCCSSDHSTGIYRQVYL